MFLYLAVRQVEKEISYHKKGYKKKFRECMAFAWRSSGNKLNNELMCFEIMRRVDWPQPIKM